MDSKEPLCPQCVNIFEDSSKTNRRHHDNLATFRIAQQIRCPLCLRLWERLDKNRLADIQSQTFYTHYHLITDSNPMVLLIMGMYTFNTGEEDQISEVFNLQTIKGM